MPTLDSGDANPVNTRRPVTLTSSFHLHAMLRLALRTASYPLRFWNWKSAALSCAIRSSVYFFIVLHHGHQAGLRAALIEATYVCLTAGFYSALQQGSMRLQPRWFANLVIVAGVPIFAQSIDFLVQHAAGTPNARAASLGMVFWGLLSASFHLHLMRNGAMIVGEEARSFANDLRRIPRLVATFVAAPVIAALALLRSREQESESEAAA